MYAIVEIAGQQFKVGENRRIFVNRLETEEGTSIEFDKVLLVDNEEGDIKVGTPVVEGAKITANLLEHLKAQKIIVFKKKKRKGFQKKNGHRQALSQIQIEKIQIG